MHPLPATPIRLPPHRCGRLWLWLTLLLVGTLRAQQPPLRTPLRPADYALSKDDNLFSLSRSQEDLHQWELACAELDAGAEQAAVARLYGLLSAETGGVASVGAGRFVGFRLALVRTLAELPPLARSHYERLVQRDASWLAQRPWHLLSDEQLASLAQRFPAAALGQRARVRLGDLALERGDGHTACSHFLAAFDGTAIGSPAEREVWQQLGAARAVAEARLARSELRQQRLDPAGQAALQAMPAAADGSTVASIGGPGEGCLPMTNPVGTPLRKIEEVVAAPGFDRRDSSGFAMHAVGDLDGIYINTGRELLCFDPLRGALAWSSESPVGATVEPGWSSRQYDDQVNPDMVLAAACNQDIVVAPLQVPDKGENVDFHGGLRILSKIPQRRLFAWSRRTGELLWSHFDAVNGTRTRRFLGHDACGPPCIVGDTVYAPVIDRSGAIQFAVAAYELRTGQPKWRRLICSSQQDVNMFGNARTEFAASPLTIAEGMLLGASNLGLLYALELATGRVRWITSYPVVQMPRTQLHGQRDRVVYFANNAPVVKDRVLCATPLDSQWVLGVDIDRGELLWRLAADAEIDGEAHHVRWLAGAIGHEFLLHGYGCVAVTARSADSPLARSVLPAISLRERGDGHVMPRAAVSEDRLWFARSSGISSFDLAGQPVGEPLPIAHFAPGNLLLVDGIVVSLRQRALDILLDPSALQSRVAARLQDTPEDPRAILRVASLQAALLGQAPTAAQLASVTELYESGLRAALRQQLPTTDPVRAALQRELFAQSLQRAKLALATGDASATQQLRQAREYALDDQAWLQVQAELLAALANNSAAMQQELEVLAVRAPNGSISYRNEAPMPVPAFLHWQHAGLASTPAAAVHFWQLLLETHPQVEITGTKAAALAQANMQQLVQQHGKQVYQEVEQRAAEGLAAARGDLARLAQVCTRFPNSQAAVTAASQLLDTAVEQGDLAQALTVLGQQFATPELPAGLLRRLALVAARGGNFALSQTALQRLLRTADAPSDLPSDQGAYHHAIAARELANLDLSPALPAYARPQREIARIHPRPREALRLLPVQYAHGFGRSNERLLFAVGGSELLVLDVTRPNAGTEPLMKVPVQFLEHVVVCGQLLVVPDLERVAAYDLLTNELRWELSNPQRLLYDGLGVQAGILHLSGQSTERDGGAVLLGLEPLSGTVVFSRSLPAELARPVPKQTEHGLLVVEAHAGNPRILRLDPMTGAVQATIPIPTAALQLPEGKRSDQLFTRMFVQRLQATSNLVLLPLDGDRSTPARVVALRENGEVTWNWQGEVGQRVSMLAASDNRVVALTSGEPARPQLALLQADDGHAVQQMPFAGSADPLNWQASWLSNPCPSQLCVLHGKSSVSDPQVLGLDVLGTGYATELLALSPDDAQIERQPLCGTDFVTLGQRTPNRGALRLHCLDTKGSSAPASERRTVLHVRAGETSALAAVGPYTVISGTDGLMVLGPATQNR